MTPGLLYLKVKRSWRAWLKISALILQEPLLLKKLNKSKRADNVVVSLTSIPSRMKSVEHTLRSIISGTVLPEAVCLYVDEQTSKLIISQSKFLKHLSDVGFLRLNAVEDVRSYTKFVYALQQYPEKNIVICDDDVLYPDYWLSALLEAQKTVPAPNTIICHRAHKVTFQENGNIDSYTIWPKEVLKDEAGSILFPTGTGGVLYPAHCMPAITGDKNAFKAIAPTADDIWFWLSAISNGCTFKLTNVDFKGTNFPEVPDSQGANLWSLNVNQNANDTQLYKSLKFFWEKELFKVDSSAANLLYGAKQFIK